MKKLIMLALIILIIGCAADGRWLKKEGQPNNEFWDDNTKCHQYAEWALRHRAAIGTGTSFEPLVERKHFNNCMREKGHQWEVYKE